MITNLRRPTVATAAYPTAITTLELALVTAVSRIGIEAAVAHAQALARGAEPMAICRRVVCSVLILVAVAFLGGCSASGPEPTLETAYSAVGAQVK